MLANTLPVHFRAFSYLSQLSCLDVARSRTLTQQ